MGCISLYVARLVLPCFRGRSWACRNVNELLVYPISPQPLYRLSYVLDSCAGGLRTTLTPAARAELIMVEQRASRPGPPRSTLFTFAISYTCFREMQPLSPCPGRSPPLLKPAAFFMKYEAGGVFISHSNDLSL